MDADSIGEGLGAPLVPDGLHGVNGLDGVNGVDGVHGLGWRAHALAAALLGAVIVAAWWPVVEGSFSIYGLDRYFQHEPFWEYALRSFASGEWPFWTPLIRAGYPLHANGEASLFHPLAYPLLSGFAAHRALDLFTLLNLFLSGFAMWLYLRERSLAPPLALLGAVAFALSGRMVASSIWAHAVAASITLPLVLLGIERAGRNRAAGMAWIALGVGLGGLAGRPQRLAPSLLLAAAYALCIALGRRRRGRGGLGDVVRDLSGSLAAVVLGLGLAAVQLLPTAAFVAESQWALEIPYQEFSSHSLRNSEWTSVWLPAAPGGRVGARCYPGIAVYAGLLLAMLALLRGRRTAKGAPARDPRIAFFLASAAVCIYFAADGPGTYELFKNLPVLRSLRSPVRFLFPACFALVAAAALGAHSRIGSWPRARWLAIAFLGIAELVVVARGTAPVAPAEIYRTAPTALAEFAADLRGPDAIGAEPRFAASGFWVPPAWVARTPTQRVIRRFEALVPTQNLAMRYDLHAALGYGEPQFGWQEALMGSLLDKALLDQLGVRLLFLNAPSSEFEALGRHGLADVHRNLTALPRAICVDSFASAASSYAAALRASAAGFDRRRIGVLEVPEPPRVDSGPAALCDIRWVEESSNRVVLDVRGSGRRGLLLFDAWAPGWSVQVDSERADLYRANGMFRALVVPDGGTRVEFSYQPPGLVAGVVLSGIALVILAGLALLLLLRR